MDAEAIGRIHQWQIDPAQYARQESRRGRRHAFEQLDPARTALIVIDMVPFFVEENLYCRGIVPNISYMAQRLRAAGGTVAWVLPAVEAEISLTKKEFFRRSDCCDVQSIRGQRRAARSTVA